MKTWLLFCPIQDLEDFVGGSGDHGFIIFSLGSIIKFLPDAPETRFITRVLSKLPQRVIWKHDGPTLLNLGPNIKTMKWLPQNDLLGKNIWKFLCYLHRQKRKRKARRKNKK